MPKIFTFDGKTYALDKEIAENSYPIISWSMGYGKTYYTVKGHFKRLLERVCGYTIDGLVVLVVPTTALKDEILSKYPDLTEELCAADFYGDASGKIKVCCMAMLANLIKDNPKLKAPGLLIIDECDLIAKWSVGFDGYPQVWDWIDKNRPQMKFLGLTATPCFLTQYVAKYSRFNFVDITPNSKPNYLADEIFMAKESHVETLIAAAHPSATNKILVYVQSAKRVDELAAKFAHSAFIVSKSNESASHVSGEPVCERMSNQVYKALDTSSAFPVEREYSIHEYLNAFHKLPDDVNVLIINDAASTGINIEDESVQTVICKSIDLDTICQVKGRVRHDIRKLYLSYGNGDIYMNNARNKDARSYFNVGELPEGYDEMLLDTDKEIKGDLLVYTNSKRKFVSNVFAKAMCAYRYDISRSLYNDPQAYFDSLSNEAKSGFVSWIDDAKKEALRVRARHFKDVAQIDWVKTFGLSDDVPQVYMTAKEMRAALKGVRIRKPNRDNYGLETMVTEANKSEQILIIQEEKKRRLIDSEGVQRNTKWYCVSLACS